MWYCEKQKQLRRMKQLFSNQLIARFFITESENGELICYFSHESFPNEDFAPLDAIRNGSRKRPKTILFGMLEHPVKFIVWDWTVSAKGRANVLSPYCFRTFHFPHSSWPSNERSKRNSICLVLLLINFKKLLKRLEFSI